MTLATLKRKNLKVCNQQKPKGKILNVHFAPFQTYIQSLFNEFIPILCYLISPFSSYKGGCFQTLEIDGTVKRYEEFNQGDALIFLSHKKHSVDLIRTGRRKVLVAEFWEGEAKTCAHRCVERYGGQCRYCVFDAKMNSLSSNVAEDI